MPCSEGKGQILLCWGDKEKQLTFILPNPETGAASPWLRPPSSTPYYYFCNVSIEPLYVKSLSYMKVHLPSLNGNQCDLWVKGDPPKISAMVSTQASACRTLGTSPLFLG